MWVDEGYRSETPLGQFNARRDVVTVLFAVVWSGGRVPRSTLVLRGRIERAGLGYNPGMKRDFDDLLKDALKLPQEARAALAGSLIDSLDATVDDNVEAAWEAEIARRLQEIQEGQAALIPWTEVRRRLIGQ